MKKRTIIILLVLSSLVSLSITLLTYFGIVRYIQLRIQYPENFIKLYSNLPKSTISKRNIVTFSTTPDKINKITPMINSILDQTIRVDQIILVVPNKRDYNIPTYLTKVVNILSILRSYGEGTKLIPLLLREKDARTNIIALQDNIVYGKDFLEIMIDTAEKNIDTVLVDKNKTAILIKPSHYEHTIINRDKKTYNDDWFTKHAKKIKIVDYSENYKFQ